MICTCIQHQNLEEIFHTLERVEMAEIRLDRCPLSDEDIEELFSSCDLPLIATCRVAAVGEAEAERRLRLAIEAGAKYADLEIEAPTPVGKRLRRACVDAGTIMIRSYHNYDETPSAEVLAEKVSLCRRFGGEIVKVVTMARSERDWETVQKLYGEDMEGQLIAFCMGAAGRASRLECLRLGAPYTYACVTEEEAIAPGQWPVEKMAAEIYKAPFKGAFHNYVDNLPASKSFAQRAILAAALAEGTSRLHGYSPCADSTAAIAVARALGAEVAEEDGGRTLAIRGIGPVREDLGLDALFTGESGLLTRLSIPLMALLNGKNLEIRGEGTLLRRPLAGANEIMAAFGVVLTNAGTQGGKEIFIPARIAGRLIPGHAEISGKGGSQLISGLLMALPLADKDSILYIQEPKSIPYMFITVDILKRFGIQTGSEMEGDDTFLETRDWNYCTGMTFKVRGGQRYKAAEFDIEADWSSAANMMVAGAIFGSARLTGLDTHSLQADLSILDVLVEAGASVSQDETGEVNVCKAPLNAFQVDLNNAPDLFPITAVLAAFSAGTSRLGGVGRLAGKESNRAEAILEMLLQLGVEARIEGDEMVIRGHSLATRLATGTLLRGGDYTSRHDHRMVMALKVAELGADGAITIDDTDCVSKSYPDFLRSF